MITTPILGQFYANKAERKAVQDFMIEVLKEMAWDKAFDGDPVTGIKEARDLVDKFFYKLDDLYGEKAKILNTSNR